MGIRSDQMMGNRIFGSTNLEGRWPSSRLSAECSSSLATSFTLCDQRRQLQLYHAALQDVRQRKTTYGSFGRMFGALRDLRLVCCLGEETDRQLLLATVMEDWLDALHPGLYDKVGQSASYSASQANI